MHPETHHSSPISLGGIILFTLFLTGCPLFSSRYIPREPDSIALSPDDLWSEEKVKEEKKPQKSSPANDLPAFTETESPSLAQRVDDFPDVLNLSPPNGIGNSIRVLLLEGKSRVRIKGKGGLLLRLAPRGKVQEIKGNSYDFVPHRGGLKEKRSGKTFTGAVRVRGARANDATLLKNSPYNGLLEVSNQKGKLRVLNILDMELYLEGVVPREIGALQRDGLEAAKAQAIAARTYAYGRKLERQQKDFDVYADTRDQVYGGVIDHPISRMAVRLTRRMVLYYRSKLAECYYHSTCGGRTADIAKMWQKEKLPYLRGIRDLDSEGRPWCRASNYMSWERSWKRSELEKHSSVGSIQSVVVTKRSPSGRVETLSVLGSKGTTQVLGDKTRWLLRKKGAPILPSSSFELLESGSTFRVKGKGFGHGIGLCQMGARARAVAGQDFREILETYYPKTELVRYD